MIYNCPKCGLSKSDSAMGSILPQCKCDWNSKSLQLQHYNCNGMPAYEGSLSKDQVLAQPNDFNPDWDAMAVMVEEQQRMAKRIEELEARLAQPEQEPVAWRFHDRNMWCYVDHLTDLPQDKFKPLYTAPPQREWVGLTDEEARELCVANVPYVIDMVRALEAKLKEKNG